jgi:hypothetical protein
MGRTCFDENPEAISFALQAVEDSRPKSNFGIGRKAYEQDLAEQLKRLAYRNQRILKRLTPEQQRQLAGLVFELTIHFEEHRRRESTIAELREQLKDSKRLEHEVVRAKRVIGPAIQRLRGLASDLRDHFFIFDCGRQTIEQPSTV